MGGPDFSYLFENGPQVSENQFNTCRGRCPHRPEAKACVDIMSAPDKLPIAIRNIPRHFRRCGRGIRRKHWINWQELWTRDFSANHGRKSGGILDVFPTFSDEEWTEKIRPQPQTIYSVLPNGGGFSAAPLKPASYQCSCRDKNIASGGTRAEIFLEWRTTRTVFYHGTMRASSPTSSIMVLGMTGGLPHQCCGTGSQ